MRKQRKIPTDNENNKTLHLIQLLISPNLKFYPHQFKQKETKTKKKKQHVRIKKRAKLERAFASIVIVHCCSFYCAYEFDLIAI